MLYFAPNHLRLRLLAVIALTVLTCAVGLWAWTPDLVETRGSPSADRVPDSPVLIQRPEPLLDAAPQMTLVLPGPRPALPMRAPEVAPGPRAEAVEPGVAPVAEQSAPDAPMYEVRARALNVRNAPSLRAPVVFTLAQGTIVPVLEVQRRWAQVETIEGATGWVNIKYLAPAAATGPTSAE